MNNPDEAIEQVLKALGKVESPAGMEARILRAMETGAGGKASRGSWHGGIAYRGWLWAGAAAITGACVLAIFAPSLHKADHVATGGHGITETPAPGRLTDADGPVSQRLLSRGMAQAMPGVRTARLLSTSESAKSAGGTLVRTGLEETSGLDYPTDFDSLATSEMLASSKPAPPLPLTHQEKLLAVVVQRGDAEQIAELKPDLRAKQVEIAKAEFHAFLIHRRRSRATNNQPGFATKREMTMRFTKLIVAIALTLSANGATAHAQTDTEAAKTNSNPTQVFYLNNISNGSEGGDIVAAIRTMLDPRDKVFLVQAQSALFIQGPPEQLVLAKKLIDDLDHARRTFRLTYTITEVDDGKRVGTQHYSMVLVSGQQTTMKQGSKVPVATGTTSENGSASTQTQFTYLDVGLNFNATLDESVNGVRLRSKAEQSSLGADKSIAGVQEPVVRQTVLEGTSILTPGKPLILGSLDIPDSTRRLDIEVVMEVVK